MNHAHQLLSFDIAPHVTETGQTALKLSFGHTQPVLYLDTPQARALASSLIELAYRIDVKSGLKQTAMIAM